MPHDGIPADLACTYACAGLTAYGSLGKIGALSEADFLLMIGAGGVGQSALHMAKALTPAKVIVADVDPAKRRLAEEAGAHAVVDNGAEDAAAKVMELTGGGARAAIDFVGAVPSSKFGLSSLRKGGRLIVVGLYGGALPVALPLIPARSLTIPGLLCRHARGIEGRGSPSARPAAYRRSPSTDAHSIPPPRHSGTCATARSPDESFLPPDCSIMDFSDGGELRDA